MSLSQESQERVQLYATDQLYRTIRTAIRGGVAVAIFYFAFHAVEALAGQDTNLSVAMTLVLSAFADFRFAFAITLGGAGAAWAMVERSLRHRKVDYMQGRIKELEGRLDPSRSSSGLTTAGKTNPRDKV